MDNYNDYEEEPKKFVLTRGMVLIFAIILIILIVIIVTTVSSLNKNKKQKITKDDCLYLEKRMEEETPTIIERLKLDINIEPQKIDLKDFLDENGGPIVAKKVPATKICEGYVLTKLNNDKTDLKAYIKCDDIYITKGYETNKEENTKITTTTKFVDKEKPTIVLKGEEVIRLSIGSEYNDPGVIAKDNIDGDITSKVTISGKVNTNIASTYVLIYTIKDKAGNSSEISRKVIVEKKVTTTTKKTSYTTTITTIKTTTKTTTRRNTTPPTIILSGSTTITINQGTSYKEPGYSARDVYGNNLTNRVKVSSNVNVNKAGSYTIKYTVTDSYGNTSSKTRIVIVKSSGTGVTSIKVTPNTATIQKNKTLKLTITKTPSNATNSGYTYSSSNSNIATVSSSGIVTGKNVGTVTITVKSSNGKTATCTITVTN